ncbi:unnamed protein product, partial [marine sediment metagenome]
AIVGTISNDLVEAVDLFPTVMEIAGVQASTPESVSFNSYLVDPLAATIRNHVFSERFLPNGGPPAEPWIRAARGERYKLIHKRFGPELYDLESDPFEEFPLSLATLSGPELNAYDELAPLVGLPEPGQLTLLASGIVFLHVLVRARRRSAPDTRAHGDWKGTSASDDSGEAGSSSG